MWVGCVLDESGAGDEECRREVASGRKVAGAIRSQVNARGLELDFARVMHEGLHTPFPFHGSEALIWSKKERSRIRSVQMDNLRGLLGIRRMNRVPSARIREL